MSTRQRVKEDSGIRRYICFLYDKKAPTTNMVNKDRLSQNLDALTWKVPDNPDSNPEHPYLPDRTLTKTLTAVLDFIQKKTERTLLKPTDKCKIYVN